MPRDKVVRDHKAHVIVCNMHDAVNIRGTVASFDNHGVSAALRANTTRMARLVAE